MGGKAVVFLMYGVSLYIIVSRWYKQGGSGPPDPKIIGPATYLFAILTLLAEFLEGFPIILAVALTFILWQRASAAPIHTAAQPTSKVPAQATNAFSPGFKTKTPAVATNAFSAGYSAPNLNLGSNK